MRAALAAGARVTMQIMKFADRRVAGLQHFRDRDLGGYVAEARKTVADTVKMDAGSYVTWSGQFEYLERATKRLQIVVPATLLLLGFIVFLGFPALAVLFE